MNIETTRFGNISVENSKVVTFEKGILGFEKLQEYVLLSSDDSGCFYWLQAVNDPELAIACMDPLNVCEDYSPLIEDEVIENLGISNLEEILILCVAVIPEDIMKATINLAAPILINIQNNKGRQVVLQNDRYELRHLVFKQSGKGIA